MGNHTIDCDFCYKDQRAYGDNCCEQNIKHREELKNKRLKEVESRNKILEHFKINFSKYNQSIHQYINLDELAEKLLPFIAEK